MTISSHAIKVCMIINFFKLFVDKTLINNLFFHENVHDEINMTTFLKWNFKVCIKRKL